MKRNKLFKTTLSVFLAVFVGAASIACSNTENKTARNESIEGVDTLTCSCPHCVICIQPYGNFTKQEVARLLPDLENNFGEWIFGGWDFKVMDPKPLPPESYVKSRNRYKAGTILKSLQKNPAKENGTDRVYIGLTHEDICTDIHGVENYGIIGFSYSPGNVCVVSDKRLKTKSMVWKPILHEFMHAFFGAKHCPNDDPHCFMVDFKGKGNVNIQNKLCGRCRI